MTAGEITRYLAAIGARGGRAGKGASKRRAPGHYARMAKLRIANSIERRKPLIERANIAAK